MASLDVEYGKISNKVYIYTSCGINLSTQLLVRNLNTLEILILRNLILEYLFENLQAFNT